MVQQLQRGKSGARSGVRYDGPEERGTAMATAHAKDGRIRWWVPGDWNAFFGLFTNVLLNVIVLTGLALGVVQLPDEIVFGRILPALGIALPIGNLYYAYLAWRLAKREGRGSVTAMPYGPSVPHMFIVVFLIMLPIYLQTKDPILAWQVELAPGPSSSA
jgi:AGZA family xanthine/uracil permease-like MFS transporter